MKKILFVTALQLEFESVKSYLTDNNPVKHPETGTYYNKGLFNEDGNSCEVYIVETGAGNVRAAEETSRAISLFSPDYIFFMGVAGGIKDVTIGDVVASTKVIGYEGGKADEIFKPRYDVFQSSYELEQLAKFVSREGKWANKIQSKTKPRSFVAPIAAGEKIISSTKTEIYNNIKSFLSDALAVEMEGAGFLQAVRVFAAQGIVVRGISDLLDKKEEADNSGSQPNAASNAIAFAFQMIVELLRSTKVSIKLETNEDKNILVEKLSLLYELGPEDNNIWKRAGGHVSILSNSDNRKTQWYNAIDILSKGGGGNITLESLIEEVENDFPDFNRIFQNQT